MEEIVASTLTNDKTETDKTVTNDQIDKFDQYRCDISLLMSNGQVSRVKRSKAIKYFKLTKQMANIFSKDPSTKVGALFIYPGTLQILSMGYNGMPRGFDESIAERWARPLKYQLVEHAERNAIYNAAQAGTPLRDSICVASMCPCNDCARGIIQSGCKMVITCHSSCYDDQDLVSRWKPGWDLSIAMFQEVGVKVMFLYRDEIDT
jgi:dCMP deaminase